MGLNENKDSGLHFHKNFRFLIYSVFFPAHINTTNTFKWVIFFNHILFAVQLNEELNIRKKNIINDLSSQYKTFFHYSLFYNLTFA